MALEKQEYVGVIISVCIVITILILLFTNMIKFSDVSAAIASILVAGISGVLVWGFRSRITGKTTESIRKEKMSNQEIMEKTRKYESTDNKERIKSTLKIRVDDYKVYEFNLKRGERITGKILSDGIFNVYFLTKSSFRSFENGNGFSSIDAIEEAHFFEPNFEAPRRDLFFIVIENEDKTNIIVDIELYV